MPYHNLDYDPRYLEPDVEAAREEIITEMSQNIYSYWYEETVEEIKIEYPDVTKEELLKLIFEEAVNHVNGLSDHEIIEHMLERCFNEPE